MTLIPGESSRRSCRPAWRAWIARSAILCLALPVAIHLAGLAPARAESRADRALPTTQAPPPAVDPALLGAIRDLTADGPALDGLIETDAAPLQQFYASRDYAPIWVTSAGLRP